MPNQLSVHIGRLWAHHAVDPIRIEQSLIYHWTFVVELPVHGEVVTSLERDRASSTHLICSNGYRNADLPRHRRTADDRLDQLQRLHHGRYGADIGVFVIRMVSRDVVLARKRPSVGWQIEGNHGAFLHHAWIVHHTVILTAITSSCVAEYNRDWSVARGLVEDLGPAPHWGIDIYVASDDVIFAGLVLILLWHRAMKTLAKQFKETGGQVSILGEAHFVSNDAYALLFDVHSLKHLEGQHITFRGQINFTYIPEDRQMIGKGL